MTPRRARQARLPVYHLEGAAGLERLRQAEWLLTNGMSGFAMGSASGVPSRRYHGLLVSDAPESPERRVYVNAVEEELVISSSGRTEVRALSSFCFRSGDGSDVIHPEGCTSLVSFAKGAACRWEYEAGGVKVVKTLALRRDARAAVVDYRVSPARGVKVELRVRPLLSLRNFHWTQRRDGSAQQFEVTPNARGCVVRRSDGAARVFVSCTPDGEFEPGEQWWYNFVYATDRARGQECIEDLFAPGEFVLRPAPRRTRIDATVQMALDPDVAIVSAEEVEAAESARREAMIRSTCGAACTAEVARLASATDDFVIGRRPASGGSYTSVIAGYPWFADWGRDSMISLPGLFLVTGRHEEALAVLERFAGARRNGIIPNRFGDELGEPLYNTVDASLWFIVACWEYRRATGDAAAFERALLPACLDVVERYRSGTDFGIGMDPHDFLIAAGTPMTQLTWMDAMRDGVVFTPRHGKAVEINALWASCLAMLGEAAVGPDPVAAADLRTLADTVAASFRARFWNEERSCCHDTLTPEGSSWRPVPDLRPNQIFAVSLPYSPLSFAQREGVVKAMLENLYTPMGVRTLEPGHPAYRGRFHGPLFELDGAYHNGTAWPWLLGPLAEAVMRVDGFSPGARARARELLTPIVAFLDGWCLGQLPEVFDADGTPQEPQRPGGCPAQAWSVAEVLRAWLMTERGENGGPGAAR